jgi:hypothetical protein
MTKGRLPDEGMDRDTSDALDKESSILIYNIGKK